MTQAFSIKRPYLLRLIVLFSVSCVKFSLAQSGMEFSNTQKIKQSDSKQDIILKAAHVVPTANQLEALRDSYIAFIHFGPNTFTRKEWGSGMEDPAVFQLKQLDTDQWCKTMKAAGMTKVILTAKHHDGFVLWQSRYTDHGVMSSSFEGGEGDIMKALAQSCQQYGLKLGVYLSPADLYQIENSDGLYGNLSEYTERTIPRPVEGRPFKNKTTFWFKVDDYNEYFLNQLFELLTEYGPIHEVWFDGAHPKRKGGQTYNYQAWKTLIHTLAPSAVIFGKEDVRWVGNESGNTRNTEWNVIPYESNPDTMQVFGDITADSVGFREQLYGASYLHYQPAEVNTSIREGWFYRDEDNQRVRSADDVFDIYERAVGGNAIFLLNIPPNRQGLFSPEDVAVLKEAGKRIKATYGQNLFDNASGPAEALDQDINSVTLPDDRDHSVVVALKKPKTINRLLIQEAVATHGERVEAHALDAWMNGRWQEVMQSTNIGFKRILRFPEVTSDKFRLRILASRAEPAIATLSAYFYKSRPPQLDISRNPAGMVTIQPKHSDFAWKPHGRDALENLNNRMEIRYTTAEGSPSTLYKGPFNLPHGTVKAVAVAQGVSGSEASGTFGFIKKDWQAMAGNSHQGDQVPSKAFDADATTYWQSGEKGSEPSLSIDLGQKQPISAFSYTPPQDTDDGMIEQGTFLTSDDGKHWKVVETFEFGNLINDPSTRTHHFDRPVDARYIKISADRIAGDGHTAAVAEIELLAH